MILQLCAKENINFFPRGRCEFYFLGRSTLRDRHCFGLAHAGIAFAVAGADPGPALARTDEPKRRNYPVPR